MTPDATDANNNAAAAPAPSPTRTICIIVKLSRSLVERLETDQFPPQPGSGISNQ
jgi:hypothetical protein